MTPTPAPAPPSILPPTITSHPQSLTVSPGQVVTLSVGASGTAPLSYQWFVGPSGVASSPIGDATASIYTTPGLSSTTQYWVRVTNGAGSTDSHDALVTVTTISGSSAFENEVLSLVNQRRAGGATCGGTAYPPVGPLSMDGALRNAARAHSEDMATQNYFSHTSLDGRTFSQRMSEAGYAGSYPWGENIAAGMTSPQAVVDAWMASSGHCSNIMNGSYGALGVGYAFGAGSTYGHYWTQDFGGLSGS